MQLTVNGRAVEADAASRTGDCECSRQTHGQAAKTLAVHRRAGENRFGIKPEKRCHQGLQPVEGRKPLCTKSFRLSIFGELAVLNLLNHLPLSLSLDSPSQSPE